MVGTVEGNAIVPVMDILFCFKLIAEVSSEESEPVIDAVDSALKTAGDVVGDSLNKFPRGRDEGDGSVEAPGDDIEMVRGRVGCDSLWI